VIVPADLVPLARVLIQDDRIRGRLAAIIAETWAARAGREVAEPAQEIAAEPDFVTLTVRSPSYQIEVDQSWRCFVGRALSISDIRVLPGGKAVTMEGNPVDRSIAVERGLDLAALQLLIEIAGDAQDCFVEWFIAEAAAGRLELWGAAGSELAGLKRIEPHALGTGSHPAAIDFAAGTLTSPMKREVVYALHVRWSDRIETKSPKAKATTAGKPTAALMLDLMQGSPDRAFTNHELRDWWKKAGGALASFPTEKKEARDKLSKLNPELAARYGKFDPRPKPP
jgi:hypothetical protein